MYVQRNSQPLKSGPDSTQHSERQYTHCEHGVASECGCISYAKLPYNIALFLSIILEAVLSRTPRVAPLATVKLVSEWVLIRVNFDLLQDIGPR